MIINLDNAVELNKYEEKAVLFLLKSLTEDELKKLVFSEFKMMVLNNLYNNLLEKEKLEKYIKAVLE